MYKMANNNIKPQSNFNSKARHTLIFSLAMVLIVLLSIVNVSAVTTKDFIKDEVRSKEFKTNFGTITIGEKWFIDLFGWFKKDVEIITLIENSENCRENCFMTINITMVKKGQLVEGVKFETIKNDGSKIEQPINSYQFYIQDGETLEKINDYELICEKTGEIASNGSSIEKCENVLIGFHIKTTPIWIPYNYEEVKKGNYILKLEGNKKATRIVDWIIIAQGREVKDWALWGGTHINNIWHGIVDAVCSSMSHTGGMAFSNWETQAIFNITLRDGASFTEVYLTYLNGTVIATAPCIGTICTFATPQILELNNTIYWIKTPQVGTHCYGGTGTYPYLNETVYWQHGHNPTTDGDDYSNGGYDIKSFITYLIFQMNVTLNSPDDNYISNNVTQIFNATITHIINITNASLWINEVLNQTIDLTGTSNVSNFTRTFIDGDYNWTIESCDLDGDCGWASENRTLTINTLNPTIIINFGNGSFNYGSLSNNHTVNFTATDSNLDTCWLDYNFSNTTIPCESGIVNTTNFQMENNVYNATIWVNDTSKNIGSISFSWSYNFFECSSQYNTTVYETSYQTINISLESSVDILNSFGTLNYDGKNYSGTSSCSKGTCVFNKHFDTPLVTVNNSQNKKFFWYIKLFNGSSSYDITTESATQEVEKIHMDKCNATYTTKALNFTVYEEANLSRINNFAFDANFNYWLGSGTVKQNTSFYNSTSNEINICIYPNLTEIYHTDAIINYNYNATYVERTFYYLNHSVTSTLEDVFLYLLLKSEATSFIQAVENQKIEAVIGALIHTYRYYPEIGDYKLVQVTKTNDNGKTVGYYKTETVDYKHIIFYAGIQQLETTIGKIFPETSPYTLTFRIGSAIESPIDYFDDDPTVTTTITFDSDTNITLFTWVSSDGAVKWGRLLVYQQKYSENDELLCNTSLAFSSGAVSCDVSGYDGEFIAYAYISKSPESFIKSLNFVISTGRAIFGNTGIILGWFIILTACLIFIWNPTAMIVSANVSTIFVNMIGLIEFGPIYIFAMIAISVIAIIFLKT